MSDVEIVTWRLQNFVNFNRQQTKSSVLQTYTKTIVKTPLPSTESGSSSSWVETWTEVSTSTGGLHPESVDGMWFKDGRGRSDRITHVFGISSPGHGTLVEFSNRFSGRSFLATITSRRVHRDFATMLRKETIKDCLPDRDPYDLQRAVNVYHSFREKTYKFIAKKHGVVSFRFEHVEPPVQPKRPCIHDRSEYDRNSLCSIFEYVERKRFERKYGLN